MNIAKPFLTTCLVACCIGLQAQTFTPIDRFNTERDFSPNLIVEKNLYEAEDFLRYVVRQFELPKELHLAVLANGEFMGAVRGNGTFEYSTGRNNFNKYVKLGDISLVEARYKPDFFITDDPTLFRGYINFKVSPLPNFKKAREEPIDSATSAALLAIRNEKKKRLGTGLASRSPHAGFMMGSRSGTSPLLVGIPVEVPINGHWSVQSDWTYGYSQRGRRIIIRSDGMAVFNDFRANMLEVDVQAKYHFTERYPRPYIGAGAYVQRYMTRELAQNLTTPSSVGYLRQQKNAVGIIGSIGITFESGWNFNLNMSRSVAAFGDLLFLQGPRGVGLYLEYFF